MALSSLSIVAPNRCTCLIFPSPPLPRTSFLAPGPLHASISGACFHDEYLAFGRTGLLRSTRGRRNLGTRALFGLGVPELVVIAGVTALIFGPKKLPEIGKSLGKTVKSFQQAAKEFEAEVKQAGDSVSAEPSKQEVLSGGSEREKENLEQ